MTLLDTRSEEFIRLLRDTAGVQPVLLQMTAEKDIAIVQALIATEQATISTNKAQIATDKATITISQSDLATASATSAQLDKWIAEAWKMTADSYATEARNAVVKIYSSNGNGTFTATATLEYSALHYSELAAELSLSASYTLKSQIAYNNDTPAFIPNTLASGAIMENGGNANGSYIKYADGTLICSDSGNATITVVAPVVNALMGDFPLATFPIAFVGTVPIVITYGGITDIQSWGGTDRVGIASSLTQFRPKVFGWGAVSGSRICFYSYVARGKWK